MMKDPELYRHKEWLGFLQPVGLVVSPLALIHAQAFVNKNVIELQQTLQSLLSEDENTSFPDFKIFALEVLEWQEEDLTNDTENLIKYELKLSEFEEILSPSYVVLDPDSDTPLLLVKEYPSETPLDELALLNKQWINR